MLLQKHSPIWKGGRQKRDLLLLTCMEVILFYVITPGIPGCKKEIET